MSIRLSIDHQQRFGLDYLTVQGHDLQDVLLRIGMGQAASRFGKLWVRLNPYVACDDPAFLAEVWGIEIMDSCSAVRRLYVAPGALSSVD